MTVTKPASVTNKSLPSLAQPYRQSYGKLIRIRPYRPSDSEQVRELFKASMLGPGSPIQVALNAQFRGPTACVSYCAIVLGILLANFVTDTWIRRIGVALGIAGCILFATLQYTFSYMISNSTDRAMNGNLKDISKTFGMQPVVSQTSERTGEYIPSGAGGFWVAEAYERNSESRAEIIGSVGLDANKNSDETNAELCRMMVSQDYRRRGIAISLIKTALYHAQDHGVTSVVLSTTMLQPAAIAMYEKFGWVRQKSVGMRILLDRIWVLYYSLDLTTIKV